MKIVIVILLVFNMIIPQKYLMAEPNTQINTAPSIYPQISASKSFQESELESLNQLQNKDTDIYQTLSDINRLKFVAKQRIPLTYTLDSSLKPKLRETQISLNYSNGTSNVPVEIKQISPNGVLTPKEKLKFFKILESNNKTLEDVREGRLIIVFHYPEDLERAQIAKEIQKKSGKEVLLLEVPKSIDSHFKQLQIETKKSLTARAWRALKGSANFLKDTFLSAFSMESQGEFKKYVDTVYVTPTHKDNHVAMLFTTLNVGFSSVVFWGLNMDPASFMGYLSMGAFTTAVLGRYWRTVTNILKTDINNPFYYVPVWREIFSRVLVLSGTTTTSQFAIGNHLNSLQYLPAPQVAVGNMLTLGLAEAYHSTYRNRLLTPEAATTMALYAYVAMSLPSRAIAQYSDKIQFNSIPHIGQAVDTIWNTFKNFHLDFGIVEFTGTSLFILGSYIVITEFLKRRVKQAETVAKEGFFKYLFNRFRKPQNGAQQSESLNSNTFETLTCRSFFS